MDLHPDLQRWRLAQGVLRAEETLDRLSRESAASSTRVHALVEQSNAIQRGRVPTVEVSPTFYMGERRVLVETQKYVDMPLDDLMKSMSNGVLDMFKWKEADGNDDFGEVIAINSGLASKYKQQLSHAPPVPSYMGELLTPPDDMAKLKGLLEPVSGESMGGQVRVGMRYRSDKTGTDFGSAQASPEAFAADAQGLGELAAAAQVGQVVQSALAHEGVVGGPGAGQQGGDRAEAEREAKQQADAAMSEADQNAAAEIGYEQGDTEEVDGFHHDPIAEIAHQVGIAAGIAGRGASAAARAVTRVGENVSAPYVSAVRGATQAIGAIPGLLPGLPGLGHVRRAVLDVLPQVGGEEGEMAGAADHDVAREISELVAEDISHGASAAARAVTRVGEIIASPYVSAVRGATRAVRAIPGLLPGLGPIRRAAVEGLSQIGGQVGDALVDLPDMLAASGRVLGSIGQTPLTAFRAMAGRLLPGGDARAGAQNVQNAAPAVAARDAAEAGVLAAVRPPPAGVPVAGVPRAPAARQPLEVAPIPGVRRERVDIDMIDGTLEDIIPRAERVLGHASGDLKADIESFLAAIRNYYKGVREDLDHGLDPRSHIVRSLSESIKDLVALLYKYYEDHKKEASQRSSKGGLDVSVAPSSASGSGISFSRPAPPVGPAISPAAADAALAVAARERAHDVAVAMRRAQAELENEIKQLYYSIAKYSQHLSSANSKLLDDRLTKLTDLANIVTNVSESSASGPVGSPERMRAAKDYDTLFKSLLQTIENLRFHAEEQAAEAEAAQPPPVQAPPPPPPVPVQAAQPVRPGHSRAGRPLRQTEASDATNRTQRFPRGSGLPGDQAKPKHLVKGSPEALAHMARVRAARTSGKKRALGES
jgi:hypothetical protein